MLGVKAYDKKYQTECRSRVTSQLAAYKKLTKAAVKASDDKSLLSAINDFECVFFNNMVLTLDSYFTHRLRGVEGKDGNPLNEVRMLCASIVGNNSVLKADNSIKYVAVNSVLGYEIGDKIQVDEAGFKRLADAYFDEIESKF